MLLRPNRRGERTSAPRCHRLFVLLATLLLPTACTSYERRAIDLSDHQAAFLARSAPTLGREHSDTNQHADLSDGCSLHEAELLALLMNPDLRVARAKVGVAEASAAEARRWDDPRLGVDLTRILASVAEPWELASTVQWSLPISGRLSAERERMGAERDAELRRVHAAEWATRMAVREVWTERITATRRARELQDDIARVEAVLTLVERLEAAGEISRLQARLFRIEASTRRDALQAADARASDAELHLRSLIGLPPAAAIRFSDELPSSALAPADALRTSLLATSLEIAIAQAEYEVAERSLAEAVRKQYPDLDLAPGYGRESEQDRLLLGVSIPIPLLNGNRWAIAVATAHRSLAEAHLRALVEKSTSSLERALALHIAAVRRAQHIANELIPLVESQLDDARRVAELGEIDAIIVLETLSRRADARLAQIDAEHSAALATIAVQRLTGPHAPS